IVLLSTHIVEDVENLCRRLAILAAGRIVAEGTPDALIAPYRGRLWHCVVPRGQPLPPHLHATASPEGSRVIALAQQAPDPRFVPHLPRLEDVYYAALAQAHANVAEAA
ncbi:hypothetical protein NEH59_12600, partial [Xanthomonas hortorum pv. pelargonii]|nr:hypothetical protein [Xanthomonas hortorum pv. pelargonii]